MFRASFFFFSELGVSHLQCVFFQHIIVVDIDRRYQRYSKHRTKQFTNIEFDHFLIFTTFKYIIFFMSESFLQYKQYSPRIPQRPHWGDKNFEWSSSREDNKIYFCHPISRSSLLFTFFDEVKYFTFELCMQEIIIKSNEVMVWTPLMHQYQGKYKA